MAKKALIEKSKKRTKIFHKGYHKMPDLWKKKRVYEKISIVPYMF